MRAETLAWRAAAVGFCVLLTAVTPVFAQPPPAATSGPPPPVKAERIAGRIYLLTGGGGANSTLPVAADGSALVSQGKSLEEVIAATPTAEFDATWGPPDHMLFLPELKRRD